MNNIMAPIEQHSHLTNHLASSIQLQVSASRADGVPPRLENSVRYEACRLVQAGGILLRLPQEIVARGIVILQRFLVSSDGGSMLEYDPRDIAAASLYLCTKLSGHSTGPRSLLTTFAYLELERTFTTQSPPEKDSYLTEGEYEVRRDRLYQVEGRILRALGFQTHVALPYALCINYLQTMNVFQDSDGSKLARRAFNHINSALFSSQLLLLTHQPSAIAVAAIYLAARDLKIKLPELEWWEVFDVDREELGFLVLGLLSVQSFAEREAEIWADKRVPLTCQDLFTEIGRKESAKASD